MRFVYDWYWRIIGLWLSGLWGLRFAADRAEGISVMTDVCESSAAAPFSLDRQVLVDCLLANCSDVIALVDPDTTIRYVNPVAERMLGHSVAELLGSRAIDLVHPDDRPQVVQRLLLPPEA